MQTDHRANGKLAAWSHAAPFVVWLVLMFLLGEPAAWKYAVRAAVSLGLLLALRPWHWYERPRLRHLLPALGCGLLVAVVWVWPEAHAPVTLRELYLRWAVTPFGKIPAGDEAVVYAPAVCGWPLTLARLAGAALVIAVIEEFFWRGFLYRWLLGRDFLQVDLGTFHAGIFLVVALVFGLEHHRWLTGVFAGLVYGGLMVATRDIWAAVLAHVATNFLLGLYVLKTGVWVFW